MELIVRSEGTYQFAHDRVREAIYSRMAEHARAEAHLRIGSLLHARNPTEKDDEAIFEIVNQLNRGAGASLPQRSSASKVAGLNLTAGKQAKGVLLPTPFRPFNISSPARHS